MQKSLKKFTSVVFYGSIFLLSGVNMDKILSSDIVQYLENELKNDKLNYCALFSNCKKFFPLGQNALIFNYILENKIDSKLLNQTIREIKSNKLITNFEPLLDFILKTNDVELKTLAIKTISVFKNKKAIPILLECLRDKNSNYKIRLAAADSLGKIGDKVAFETLSTIACDDDEKSAYVKEQAVVALGNLGDNRALDVFSSIMSSKQMFLDKFSYLKERVVEAISKLDASKDGKAIEILKRTILDSSSRLRISAIETLMNLESDESYSLIYDRLLYDDDFEVKKNALVALYNLSDRKILDEVVNGEFSSELKSFADELIREYEDD